MYIDCVGMMRSGSTLQYNIVAEILELKEIGKRLGWEHHEEFHKIKEKYVSDKYNVFKNHFLTDEIEAELKQVEGSILMYVYRDIRDVCISIMDKANKTFEQVFNSKVLHNAIDQYYKITNSSLKKYIQSYEVMFLNTKREIKEVARFLNVELTTDEIETIYSKISFESQKENIEKYKENSEYISHGKQKFNADTLLHLNHIKDGGIGKYRERLTKAQIKHLEIDFKVWLKDQGYKLTEDGEQNEPFRRYFSQHGEDYFLWKFFDYKENGFFIEVGAFDGIHLSNSYSFELEGWTGICIEPGQYFEACKKNRPNSICINAACVGSNEIKEVTFYEEELGLLSSVEMSSEKKEDIIKRYDNRKLEFSGFRERKIKAQTLNNILEKYNITKIDFITIDVEGAEIEVLKGFDLKKHKPKVVILEANDEEHKKELIDYMTVQSGYIFVREVSVNLVFLSNKNDFNKMKDIEISCTIEKQVHPLGLKHTITDYLYGLKYFNNNNITTVLKKKNQELQQKQKVIEQKNSELNQKNQELEQKQKVIEQKNNELKEKNQELEQKQKMINKLELIYEKQNYKYSCLMDSLQNISTVSVKTNPIEKFKQYKNLLSLYHELKGNK